jgi:hypothetical protein
MRTADGRQAPSRTLDRRARRHEQAVVSAEVRRLVRAIRPYGVLNRQMLARVAGAAKWRDGGFDAALSAAVRSGALERRPFDFYSEPAKPSDQSAARSWPGSP